MARAAHAAVAEGDARAVEAVAPRLVGGGAERPAADRARRARCERRDEPRRRRRGQGQPRGLDVDAHGRPPALDGRQRVGQGPRAVRGQHAADLEPRRHLRRLARPAAGAPRHRGAPDLVEVGDVDVGPVRAAGDGRARRGEGDARRALPLGQTPRAPRARARRGPPLRARAAVDLRVGVRAGGAAVGGAHELAEGTVVLRVLLVGRRERVRGRGPVGLLARGDGDADDGAAAGPELAGDLGPLVDLARLDDAHDLERRRAAEGAAPHRAPAVAARRRPRLEELDGPDALLAQRRPQPPDEVLPLALAPRRPRRHRPLPLQSTSTPGASSVYLEGEG